ncbi:MAG: cell surface protein [Deltaproteobacteria bacterium]|nr:cell surface protein [Deltaproteobacteria bacterium]
MRGLLALIVCVGCAPPAIEDEGCDPFVVDVVSFLPGASAGFGAELMPAIVQGPPAGEADSEGSFDVVSLGKGGVIVLELGCTIEDGEGVDFIVYENAFFVSGSENVFADPGEVAVSSDGVDFVTFPCTPDGPRDDGVNGCAGTAPVVANARNGLAGDFEAGGGDGFDLGFVDVVEARFVRVTDRGQGGAGDNVGFDLDAISAVVR